MSTLHLAQADPEKRAAAIRAVRAVLASVGRYGDEARRDALTDAERAVYSVLSGGEPAGLVIGEAEAVHEAVEAFLRADGARSGAVLVVNADTPQEHYVPAPRPAEPEAIAGPSAPPTPRRSTRERIERMFVAPTPEAFQPSYQAARAALVLMAAMDGKAANAWYYAKAFGCATEDTDMWVQVANLISEAFGFEKNNPDV